MSLQVLSLPLEGPDGADASGSLLEETRSHLVVFVAEPLQIFGGGSNQTIEPVEKEEEGQDQEQVGGSRADDHCESYQQL